MNLAQFEAAFSAFCLRGPDERQNLGLTDKIGTFSPITKVALDQDLAQAKALLAQLESSIATSDGDTNLEIDRRLYTLYLNRFILSAELSYNGLSNAEQMPMAVERIGNSLFTLLINDPRPECERATDLVERIGDIPRFLKDAANLLTCPVERWLTVELDGIEGLADLIDTACAFVKAHAEDLEQTVDTYSAASKHAFTQYQHTLKALPTSTCFSIGHDATSQVIKARGIDQTPDELWTIASNFLSDTRSCIETLRVSLVKKYQQPDDTTAADLQAFLAKQFAVNVSGPIESVLDRYRIEEKRIQAFIEHSDLFPIPSDQCMEIIRTPAFLAPTIPAGAMVSPPALREGTKKSLVYLTLSPDLLSEHNELSIPVMMIHEGIPGHHLQLTWAASHPSFIRRIYDAMDLAEGWTTMLEDYMLDQGYAGDRTEEVRFMAKREICRIAARVGIDLYFMTGRERYLRIDGFEPPESEDPFVKAGALLQSVTGFVDNRVQAELNWYSRERGYPLSYLTGNHLMWNLKRDFASVHGSDTAADRRFHKTVLSNGNLPLHLLRQVFIHEGLIENQNL